MLFRFKRMIAESPAQIVVLPLIVAVALQVMLAVLHVFVALKTIAAAQAFRT